MLQNVASSHLHAPESSPEVMSTNVIKQSAANVFLSYSRKDSEKVSIVRDFLASLGFHVWFDSTTIGAGDNWPEEIVNGIKNCQLFLLAISKESITSKHVKRELTIADEEKKPIVPLQLAPPTEPDGTIRYFIAGIQTVQIDPPSGLVELEERVRRSLPQDSKGIWEAAHNWISKVPDVKIGPFHLRAGARSIITTLETEVSSQLISILAEAQRTYFLAKNMPTYVEDAIRRLRNHGLLAHDGQWLFTPTRSKTVWATALGSFLLEIGYPCTERSTLIRHAIEVLQTLRVLGEEEQYVMSLREIANQQASRVDVTFRKLRNHALIGYKTLSSKTPLLHELAVADFYLTNLGEFFLASFDAQHPET